MKSKYSYGAGTFKVGLNNCDQEPVHIPGSIQSHGLLFRLDLSSKTITDVSANVADLIGQPPEKLRGKTISEICESSGAEDFFKFDLRDGEVRGPIRGSFAGGSLFDLTAHLYKSNLIVECEPTLDEKVDFFDFSRNARMAFNRIRNAKDLPHLSAALVDEVRKVTQFERVVLYQFDSDWNGHVIAESKVEKIDSYFDLYFPATDIPSQVRALFCLNRLRLIPTTATEPSTIVPISRSENGPTIDMSLATLRAVSPIHLEYLKNMKVKASMSISILRDGRLWGLVSCSQESGARFVGAEVRATSEFLADTFSALLPVHDTDNDYRERARLMDIHSRLLTNMTNDDDFISGLLKDEDALLSIAGASGVAVSVGNTLRTVGRCPPPKTLNDMFEGLKPLIKDNVLVTNRISSLLPEVPEMDRYASGLAIFTTSRAQTNYCCWFRPEVVQTVNWGGDPNKPAEKEGDQMVLHPRKSFEIWKETVKRTSLPWKKEEVSALEKLRLSIIEIVIQRVEKITVLNTELERSNNELDSFAYAASHDMKEPLRGIHNYAAMVLRDAGQFIPPQSLSRLETILRLTQRSEDLINSLLHYSQIGRAEVVMSPVNLNEVVANALDSIRNLIDSNSVDFTIEQLPFVMGDRVQIMEVFTNLIGNAIKYNDKAHKTIQIKTQPMKDNPEFVAIAIADNGIGIEDVHHKAIFKIFKRLHGKSEYGGGSGTGLTIVKKVVERHGGSITVQSKRGQGTTFTFGLRRTEERNNQIDANPDN